MSMEYFWKQGSRLRGDPKIVGAELERIQEENGAISADKVLESAEPENSVLHQYFEWDMSKAAQQYRLEQARCLVRSVVVKITKSDDEEVTTRAFVEIKLSEGGPYMPLATVVQTPDLRAQLVKQALTDIHTFEQKYAALEEVIALLQPVKAALK